MNKKILLLAFFSLVVDQLSKILVNYYIDAGESITVINNFFSITNVTNTGAAFSILEGKVIFLNLVSFIALALLLKLSFELKGKGANLAFGLTFGGIFGNFADRLFLGSVRDFLDFNIFGYHAPIFNVADACIVVGVAVLVIIMFRKENETDGSSSK